MKILELTTILTEKKKKIEIAQYQTEKDRGKNQWTGRQNSRNYPVWKQRENKLKNELSLKICGTIVKDLRFMSSVLEGEEKDYKDEKNLKK